MDKPDRVEAGQWWQYYHSGPRRVRVDEDLASLQWYIEHATCTYLGSGPNPEPSEWMTETLARHSFEVVNAYCRSGDHASLCDDPGEWDVAPGTERQKARDVAALILAGEDPRLPYEDRGMHEGSILSLYRILRSLGKW